MGACSKTKGKISIITNNKNADLHTREHACTHQDTCTDIHLPETHNQNALKIYDLSIPSGSSYLSNPPDSGFNYPAYCRKRLF